MKTYEFTGKTVDEALENALGELKLSRDRVQYTITDEGSKGFFSLIGFRPAKINVTIKKNLLEECEIFLQEILLKIGVNAKMSIKENSDKIFIDIKGEDVRTVIGYRGETLDAIQYLLNVFINKKNKGIYKKILLDAGSYRVKREETLKNLALKTAYKVKKYGKSMKFEAMNPYERKIIHSALQNEEKILTKSEGKEPFRRVIVSLK